MTDEEWIKSGADSDEGFLTSDEISDGAFENFNEEDEEFEDEDEEDE